MDKQNVIDFLKDLAGDGGVEINVNANRLVRFNEAWGKPQIYFCAGVPKDLGRRCADGDFFTKKYIPVDIDIRKDYFDRTGKVLSHDEMVGIIMDLLHKIDNTTEFSSYSYAVCSGNGLHLYYVGNDTAFPEPSVYANGVEYMQGMLNDVIAPYVCDPAVKNLARIMRLPGTVNPRKKYRGKDVLWDLGDYVCEFLVYRPDVRTDLVEMLPILAGEYEKTHAEVRDVISKHYKVDSDWGDINSVDVGELAQLAWGVTVGRANGDVVPLKELHKNMGAYIYKPYNVVVNTGSSLIHDKDKKVFSAFDIVCSEMMGGDKKKTVEYFKEHYHVEPKQSKKPVQKTIDIPVIEHSLEKGFLYPAPIFDKYFGCFRSEDLVVVVAEPNSGKTTFALDILTRNKDEKGRKGFYVNLEFDIRNVWRQRWLSRNGYSKVNITDLAPLPVEKKIEMDAFVDTELSKFEYVNEPNGIDLPGLISILSEKAQEGYELAVIDTLGDIHGNSGTNSWSSQNETMQTLQAFVQKTGMAIILLHHKNKRGEYSGSAKIKDYSNVFISVSVMCDTDGNTYSEYELQKDKFIGNCEFDCYYNGGSYDPF